jgi:hypothetical protein
MTKYHFLVFLFAYVALLAGLTFEGRSLLAWDEPVSFRETVEAERIAPKYNAEIEVRLWDATRVDLLNDEYAIEVDRPSKWAEAIGQAGYYAELTNRKPGIVLLVSDMKRETKYIYRCQTVCAKWGIRLWLESVPGEE